MKLSPTIIVIFLLILGIILIFVLKKNTPQQTNQQVNQHHKPTTNQNDSPKIISTKPDPLENTIISADQIIEITFNRSLENEGEFKNRIDPKIDYKIQLSSDRKTAKIIPQKPYELGTTYTLFILPDSKFDGGGKLDGEKIFHFKTIAYRGV